MSNYDEWKQEVPNEELETIVCALCLKESSAYAVTWVNDVTYCNRCFNTKIKENG